MQVLWDYRGFIIEGVALTVVTTIAATIVMVACAGIVGLARLSRFRMVRTVSLIYIEFFRGTSAMVQLFWWFYALPFFGIVLPPWITAVLGLGFCLGAYGAEVVRSSVLAVPTEQVEAGRALNMGNNLIMRIVVLPQAIRTMLPPFSNLFVEMLKATALVSLITIPDLTFAGRYIAGQTFQTTPVFLFILIMYWIMSTVMVMPIKAADRRLQRSTA